MEDAAKPKKNLIPAKTAKELDAPATKEVRLNPMTPSPSMSRLFQFLDYELINMFEVEYATLNIKDATSPYMGPSYG